MTSGSKAKSVKAFAAGYTQKLEKIQIKVDEARNNADNYSNVSALAGNLAGRSLNL
jgi:hypothetical protein